MQYKKADWVLVQEAEENGLVASMTGIVERKRTTLNNELSSYFREKMPTFLGSFDEYEGEDILYNINSYLEENNIDKSSLDFPISSGSDIHLIPITENLKLKVLVVDEYFGNGDYSKYVMTDFFLINENTTKKDVDKLIEFVKKYLS